MEKRLLLATGNAHKVEEMKAILVQAGLGEWEFHTLAEYPDNIPPQEDGDSFSANAALKASAAAQFSGMTTLADDSGLTVDALNGAPGVHSARYAGEHGDDGANRYKLLIVLGQTPEEQRTAAFVCCAALAFPSEDGVALWTGEGRVEGRISLTEEGSNGFGYDCLFYLPQLDRTMAQLSEEEKNSLSHRAQAMTKAAALLLSMAEDND